jgi:hypothetical protein
MIIQLDDAMHRLELCMGEGKGIIITRLSENKISIWATHHLGIELVASNSFRVELLETESPAAGPETEGGEVL